MSTADLVQTHGTHTGVEKIILFIAYVINCTDQVKHKTEKIKITERSREGFLVLKNILGTYPIKDLEGRGKQEDQGRGQYDYLTGEHQKFDCKWTRV